MYTAHRCQPGWNATYKEGIHIDGLICLPTGMFINECKVKSGFQVAAEVQLFQEPRQSKIMVDWFFYKARGLHFFSLLLFSDTEVHSAY